MRFYALGFLLSSLLLSEMALASCQSAVQEHIAILTRRKDLAETWIKTSPDTPQTYVRLIADAAARRRRIWADENLQISNMQTRREALIRERDAKFESARVANPGGIVAASDLATISNDFNPKIEALEKEVADLKTHPARVEAALRNLNIEDIAGCEEIMFKRLRDGKGTVDFYAIEVVDAAERARRVGPKPAVQCAEPGKCQGLEIVRREQAARARANQELDGGPGSRNVNTNTQMADAPPPLRVPTKAPPQPVRVNYVPRQPAAGGRATGAAE